MLERPIWKGGLFYKSDLGYLQEVSKWSWPPLHISVWDFLTPQCPTLKVIYFCDFPQWLRVTTFYGFKKYGNNSMALRDFCKVLFFHWIWWFLCSLLYAKKLAKKSSKTKWSCFAINVWALVILTTFCVEKHYFFNNQ